MTLSAKVISLAARPIQVSYLCFEVGGILESFNFQGQLRTLLGQTIAAGHLFSPFAFGDFYTTLSQFPIVPGHPPLIPPDPSRLKYGVEQLDAFVLPYALANLRAEGAKVSLNKAMNARQNAYFAKYGNASAIVTKTQESYAPWINGSKPQRLANLKDISNKQSDGINDAYTTENPPRTKVVKTTKSVLKAQTRSQGGDSETGKTNEEELADTWSGTLAPLPAAGAPFPGGNLFWGPTEQTYEEGTTSDSSTSWGSATENQTIENTDYGYRYPYYENKAHHERAQISLIDQEYAQFMYGQNLEALGQVFDNELNSINNEVYRLQVAYLNTILMSPINGVITGVYKNPGDAVSAGEPVLRVEDASWVLLVGVVMCVGTINVGAIVNVSTSLYGVPTMPVMLSKGIVVAARGHHQENQWSVIVQVENGPPASPTVPVGYRFGYEETTFTIV